MRKRVGPVVSKECEIGSTLLFHRNTKPGHSCSFFENATVRQSLGFSIEGRVYFFISPLKYERVNRPLFHFYHYGTEGLAIFFIFN